MTWQIYARDKFEDGALVVGIEDEAAGEYVTIADLSRGEKVGFDASEWPAVKAAIDNAFAEISKHEGGAHRPFKTTETK